MLGRHLRSNVVGYVALFFALTLGTAWAATELEKNEVKSKHIKNETIKGKDVKDDTLTGGQVAESSLGKVPSATSADSATSATNADALGGISSAAFGRTAFAEANNVAVPIGADTDYGAVTSTSISSGSRAGFIVVTGHLSAYTFDEANCPCQIQMRVRNATQNVVTEAVFGDLDGTPDADGLAADEVTTTEVFAIPANSTQTLELQAVIDDTNATNVSSEARISATYVPFGANGGSTLSRQASAQGDSAGGAAQPARP